MSYWIAIACTVGVEIYVLRRLRFGWLMVATVLLGTLVSMDYLAYTSISERTPNSGRYTPGSIVKPSRGSISRVSCVSRPRPWG